MIDRTKCDPSLFYLHKIILNFLSQVRQRCKMIPHFLPFSQKFIQYFSICGGCAVQKYHGTRMYTGYQFFECLLFGGLLILNPVNICQTPEKSMISQFTGHLKIFTTVFSLRRAVEFYHLCSCNFLIQFFHLTQFFCK